jgi:hypothetical protein
MSLRRILQVAGLAMPALVAVATTAGCATEDDRVWTRSERLALAPGKEFSQCAAAVAGVAGLRSEEDRPMKAYFDDYLDLRGPAVDSLAGMVGDLSRRGTTIQVEFTSRRTRLPDDATRAATDRLVTELASRVASQCS